MACQILDGNMFKLRIKKKINLAIDRYIISKGVKYQLPTGLVLEVGCQDKPGFR